MKMNLHRAQELIESLRKGTANGISATWRDRLVEALEYVIEHEQSSDKVTSYYDGMRSGILRFAYWRGGEQFVGTSGMTLMEAFAEISQEEKKELKNLGQ